MPRDRTDQLTDVELRICTVICRRAATNWEFCLVRSAQRNRWCLPVEHASAGESPLAIAERAACNLAGQKCELAAREPLDQFATARNDGDGVVVAYLFKAPSGENSANGAGPRWCLPEEARLRLRRKPMRRLIDTAVHLLAEDGRR